MKKQTNLNCDFMIDYSSSSYNHYCCRCQDKSNEQYFYYIAWYLQSTFLHTPDMTERHFRSVSKLTTKGRWIALFTGEITIESTIKIKADGNPDLSISVHAGSVKDKSK